MAMKESGIEWVGLIPDTWSVIPNKYVMHKEKKSYNSKAKKPNSTS